MSSLGLPEIKPLKTSVKLGQALPSWTLDEDLVSLPETTLSTLEQLRDELGPMLEPVLERRDKYKARIAELEVQLERLRHLEAHCISPAPQPIPELTRDPQTEEELREYSRSSPIYHRLHSEAHNHLTKYNELTSRLHTYVWVSKHTHMETPFEPGQAHLWYQAFFSATDDQHKIIASHVAPDGTQLPFTTIFNRLQSPE